MSGVYWGLTALHLIGKLEIMCKEDVVSWVLSCQNDDAGFGGTERNDSHLLYTVSAVQILALYGELERIDASKVVQCE